jgi:hypothetical protein
MRKVGRAMAQVVMRRPLNSEDRVQARISPCGICGGQSGTGTGFSPSSSVFLCQYRSTMTLHTHISLAVINNRPIGGRSSETFSPPIDVNKNKLNVLVEWLAVLRIWEVSSSNLGPETGYPDCGFSRFLQVDAVIVP